MFAQIRRTARSTPVGLLCSSALTVSARRESQSSSPIADFLAPQRLSSACWPRTPDRRRPWPPAAAKHGGCALPSNRVTWNVVHTLRRRSFVRRGTAFNWARRSTRHGVQRGIGKERQNVLLRADRRVQPRLP